MSVLEVKTSACYIAVSGVEPQLSRLIPVSCCCQPRRPRSLGLCHSQGRPGLNLQLLAWTSPSAISDIWGTYWWIESLPCFLSSFKAGKFILMQTFEIHAYFSPHSSSINPLKTPHVYGFHFFNTKMLICKSRFARAVWHFLHVLPRSVTPSTQMPPMLGAVCLITMAEQQRHSRYRYTSPWLLLLYVMDEPTSKDQAWAWPQAMGLTDRQ